MRGLVDGTPMGGDGLADRGGGVLGDGVTPTSTASAGVAPWAARELGMIVGPTAEKFTGSGGTAVFGMPNGCGGGVGGYSSCTGMATGAGAAAACSLAPHPRQNL